MRVEGSAITESLILDEVTLRRRRADRNEPVGTRTHITRLSPRRRWFSWHSPWLSGAQPPRVPAGLESDYLIHSIEYLPVALGEFSIKDDPLALLGCRLLEGFKPSAHDGEFRGMEQEHTIRFFEIAS
jgi:hypothetical protein